MVGVPKNLNTKRDVLNLQEMAKENLIDRKEWIERLRKMQEEDIFNLPVIKKEEDCFYIPKTERELPQEYATKAMTVASPFSDEQSDERNEVIRIEGTIEENFIPLSAGYQEAVRLELSQEEISKMIEELM